METNGLLQTKAEHRKIFFLLLLWNSARSSSAVSSLFSMTNFTTTFEMHGALTTHMKVNTMTSAQNKLLCMTQCLQQVACRHVHSTTSTCYLLGTDALIGQDTAHTLQPSDLVHTLDPAVAKDCWSWYERGVTQNGVYEIDPDGQGAFEVYCELDPLRQDGTTEAGWTVFQRRVDGTTEFYRYWSDYEAGFGDLTGNHWLGLTKLARLTASGPVQLHVYLEAFDAGDWAYALYDSFQITDASDDYRQSVSGYSGTAGDSLSYHDDIRFSTPDQDNDVIDTRHCAADFYGGWWYRHCHSSNLNGRYLAGAHSGFGEGINWEAYRGFHYSLKTTVMKIKSAR